MAKKKQEDRKIVFRRIRGRIVPIAVGGAVAADAARTKRIFVDKKRGITIDKKTNVRQSLSVKGGATELVIKKKGRKVGFANFNRTQGSDFGFNFLRIRKKFQGQGLSKPLTEEAAREIKRQGGKTITNQVIHAGSISTNLSKRDKLVQSVEFGTEQFERRVSKKQAISEIGALLKGKKKSKFGKIGDIIESPQKQSDIFRVTNLKGIRKTGKFSTKPFRTTGNKLAIVGGLALAGAGAAGVFEKKKKRRK